MSNQNEKLGAAFDSDGILHEAVAVYVREIVDRVRAGWEQELELLRSQRRELVLELRLAALGPQASQAEPAVVAPPVLPAAADEKAIGKDASKASSRKGSRS